jgi:Mrp family chromosome partitioning ATPase
VSVVTAGQNTAHPSALLPRVGPLIAQARAIADVVLIDSPPLLVASDGMDLVPYVDTVLVAAWHGRTSPEHATRASELLSRFDVPILGVAVLGTPESLGGHSYYYEATRAATTRWRPRRAGHALRVGPRSQVNDTLPTPGASESSPPIAAPPHVTDRWSAPSAGSEPPQPTDEAEPNGVTLIGPIMRRELRRSFSDHEPPRALSGDDTEQES